MLRGRPPPRTLMKLRRPRPRSRAPRTPRKQRTRNLCLSQRTGPIPARPRRLSATVTKLLNGLPKPKSPSPDKEDSGAGSSTEGAGRRLLGRVGNIVNRKKVPSSEVEGEAADKAGVEIPPVTAEGSGEAPVVPPKSTEDLTHGGESKPEEAPVGADTATAQAFVAAGAPKEKEKKAPPSAAARATKLVRRLSASGLGQVFQSKSKSPAAAPKSQDKGAESKDASAEAKPVEETPVAEDAAAANAAEPTDDKALPSPPPVEDNSTTGVRLRPPPTSFKSATNAARRLSSRASDLFKGKEPSSPEGETPTTKEGGSEAAAEGLTREKSRTPSVTAATEKATELVRKASKRAQGAIAKARAKAKGEGKEKGEGSTDIVAETGAAKPEESATVAEAAVTETEAKPTSTEEGASAPPAETASETVPAESTAQEDAPTNSEDPSAAPAAEKSLPTPPASSPPSAAATIARVGKLSRRLSSRVGSLFAAHKDDAAESNTADETAANAATTAQDDKPVADGEAVVPSAEGAAVEQAPKPEAPAGEVVTVVKEGEGTTGKVVAVLENTETITTAQEKSLPSPPPSAAVSIAKVGQLTRRLSSRAAAAFRTAATAPMVPEPQAKPEAKEEGAEKEVKESAENDGGEGAPVVEGEAPATEEAKKDAEVAVPPVEGAETKAASAPPAAAPPPGAFKSTKGPKIGRRLSARVGDLFRAKAPSVPAKEADKSEVIAGTNDGTIEIKPVEEATGKVEAKEAEGAVAEAGKEADLEVVVAEGAEEPNTEVESEPAQPEASTSAQTPNESEAQPDKPLPAKPSRSARAKGAAADVGRQLSTRATELLKARPRLDEVVSRAPSAFTSRDKGKQREKDDVVAGSEGVTSAGPSKDGRPGLGKRFSKVVVDGIFGPASPKGEPHSTKAGDKLKDGEADEDWEKVESGDDLKEAIQTSAGAVQGKDGEEVIDIGNAKSEGPPSSEDVKNASVEAVEGETAAPETPKKDETTTEAKEGKGGLSAPISSLVTGLFKQKQKSPTDKPLPPTDRQHDHESPRASVDEKGGKRRRRLSLGFRSKKKGEAKHAAAAGEATAASEPAPKDAEVEKGLPEPPSNVGVGGDGGDSKAEEVVKETELQVETVEEVSTDKPQATASA
ncbi:hypothetical protein DFP72DRAFT_550905 [Ephemerocybe angulata]|uniref:Uncharacterized protein n=1 Tax=Ephemerocybe angulata TaxID=980116 RepID=A0A8H6M0M2_9AGAR|nr:hypothetical protein DFP72DRAFT_550905 [Tulosesus angulatus]